MSRPRGHLMKFFKHFADNHRGQTIQALFQEFGHEGPCCYYFLMEMCCEKLEYIDGKVLEKFRFSEQIVRRNLHISRTKLEKFLTFCQTFGVLLWKKDDNFIEIEMPILLNLLDRDMKKPRIVRAKSAQKPRLELELEREQELEKEKEEESKSSETTKLQNKQIWESYLNAYRRRYKVDPIRNASVNAQIAQLRKRVGGKAVELVEFYLHHNDGFYLSKTHSIGLCLRDCESLMTQMQRGKAITRTTVRQFEQNQQYDETARHIQEFGI